MKKWDDIRRRNWPAFGGAGPRGCGKVRVTKKAADPEGTAAQVSAGVPKK